MKDAYRYKFREGGRTYQVILSVDHESREIGVVDAKRLSPWVGADNCETDELRRIDSSANLSPLELEKLAKEGFKL